MKKAILPSALILAGGLFLSASPAFSMDASQAAGAYAAQVAPMLRTVSADPSAQAQDFIQSMAQRGIDFLSNPKLTQAQRKEEFRKLLHSSYDMQTLGRFALGTYWRTASKAQQAEYQKLFDAMVVEVYSNRFSSYNGQQLKVTGSKPQDDGDVMVNSTIVPTKGGEEINVDWRVRFNNGQPKVIDIVVEGVSMALTQRSDFASVIQRGGGNIDALLDQMRNGQLTSQEVAKQNADKAAK